LVNAYLWHEPKYADPITLLTNFESEYTAQMFYRKGFLTETLFSDQKSRGFFIHETRLKKYGVLIIGPPLRLLICTCLVYFGRRSAWLVCLGAFFKTYSKKYKKIPRKDRKDTSLFQISMKWIKSGHF
jgi:hypothetical protein